MGTCSRISCCSDPARSASFSRSAPYGVSAKVTDAGNLASASAVPDVLMPTPPTMTAIRGESFLLGGSWRAWAYRLDGRAPSGPIFGTAPWRVASTSFGSNNGFVASGLPGMVTNFLAPLEPSIIVTVLVPGGGSSGFAAGAEASGGEEVVPSWRECCLPSLSPSRALIAVGATFVATTALGSPPNWSLTKAVQATTTTPESPSAPARNWGADNGRFGSRFRLSWPRGAFRSSTKAQDPRESLRESSTRRFCHSHVAAGRKDAKAPKSGGGGLSAAPANAKRKCRSVRHGCLGIRREGRIDLGAAQKVERHVESFVVLGIGRNIGLRAGLLFALVAFQMTAQRCLALGVCFRLELVRNVLKNFNVRRNAFCLDRTAGRCEVSRRRQPQCTIARPERNDGLHRSLAERAGADHRCPPVILQRAGDDFRCGRRAAVDQNDERFVLCQIAGSRIEALRFLRISAAGGHNLALLQKCVGY